MTVLTIYGPFIIRALIILSHVNLGVRPGWFNLELHVLPK